MPPSPRRLLISVAAIATFSLACAAVPAQQGAVTFHNFRRYPTGQWEQTGQAYRDGAPLGSPITSTNCTAAGTAASAAAIKDFANKVAPQCTMRVLVDTERTAESEQTCDMGGGTQVNHMTMHAVDDKTITNELRMTINGREMSDMRSTVRYQGTCTAPQQNPAMPAMPAMPKPSAEDCKEIANMQKQAQEALKSCNNMPAAERPPNCEAMMGRLVKQTEQAAASCR